MKKIKAGFTIIEIMVALVILAFITVSPAVFSTSFQKLVIKSSQKLMAANLAREKMEELYWTSPLSATTVSETLPAGTIKNAANATRTYTIKNDATENYMIISVSVNWN